MRKEERIFWLQTFINKELKKPHGIMDADKISQYVDELLTLQGQNISLSEEEISSRLAEVEIEKITKY